MSLSRRQFLQGATVSMAATLAGCDVLKPLDWRYAPGLAEGPYVVPSGEEAELTARVLNRLSYGVRPNDVARVLDTGIEKHIDKQLAPELIEDRDCAMRVRRLEALNAEAGTLFEYKEQFLLDEMTRNTMLRAVYSERQVYELMVGFWTDHFNIASSKGDCRWLKAWDDREVIRVHALGNFRELLGASALSPAMLWYLDGRVNRKERDGELPNENYARELLELHTLGVHGGYTQRDVMEAARCLTGWTVRHNTWFGVGKVEFRPGQHDDGEKEVLGQKIPAGLGEKDVGALLDIVAFHPSTAKFLAEKLCRYFCGEHAPESLKARVAGTFANSGGNIKSTLHTLLTSQEFIDAPRERFKRPLHYVASALRATGAETDAGDALQDYLQRMGHAPFQYPTPDGYPFEAEPWYGTMLWRWHFALSLQQNKLGGTHVDWQKLRDGFEDRRQMLAHFLLRRPEMEELKHFGEADNPAALALSSPAFQKV